MLALLSKSSIKKSNVRTDDFGKYLTESLKNTTVNGTKVAKKLSWYKRIMGLF